MPLALCANFHQGETDTVTKPKKVDLSEILLEDDPFLAHMDSLLVLNFFAENTEPDTREFSPLQGESVPTTADWHDTVYANRIEKLNDLSPIELQYNPYVRAFIDLYADRRREQLSRMLGLAEYYFPMFEETLDRYDLPLELKYLAVVESALNPKARSRVGATGLWQFMYATGRLQGLKVSSYVDERIDPIKSTEAACQYLEKLYSIFGDWNLALAAYNSGPGNVSKAIRRSGGQKDYWAIRPYLPRETAGYVPAFIAVNYIMNHASDHLIFPTEVKPSFFNVDTVWVKEKLSFDQISSLINIDKNELEFLNPSYRHGIIPKVDDAPYALVLPNEKVGLFVSFEDSIYTLAQQDFKQEEEKPQPKYVEMDERIRHKVKRGEVLGTIAESYGVGVSSIRRWNGLRGNTIRIGQYLTIYPRKLPQKATASASTQSESSNNSSSDNFVTHRVRSGETFYSIARKYPGISADNIMEWNNYKNSRSLRPGASLKIFTSKS